MNFFANVHAKDAPESQPQTPTTPSSTQETVKEETSQNTNKSNTDPAPETNTNTDTTNSTSTSTTESQDPPFFWMVKPCSYYKDEYKDCKSFRERFNQYFVYGETQECSQWKGDYDNCKLWEDEKDREALDKLIEREKSRVRERLRNHFRNDIWENRTAPPEDWNSELPEFISKNYKNSYLEIMNNKIKEDAAQRKLPYAQILGADRDDDPSNKSSCVIM